MFRRNIEAVLASDQHVASAQCRRWAHKRFSDIIKLPLINLQLRVLNKNSRAATLPESMLCPLREIEAVAYIATELPLHIQCRLNMLM